jgi:hypothetical protein
MGAPVTLRESGIIVSGTHEDTIPTRIERAAIDELEETGLLLRPLVPERVVVQEARAVRDWYGNYRKGVPVVDAYAALTERIING